MSLFGNTGSKPASTSATGGSSLFSGLNLDTTVGSDQSGKRKSIFDPASTTSARSQSFGGSLFGSGSQSATTTTTAPYFSFGASTATTTAPSTAGTMFGATNTTSAAPSGGLFGAATTSAPAAGGLFGKPATTTPTIGSGLFGAAPTTTSASSGLFGATPATASSSSGLFGAKPAATSAAPTSSLFGGASTTAAKPAGASLFGASTTTTTQPASGTSLFGATTAQPANPSIATTDQNVPVTREPAYFSSLLERQKKKARFEGSEQQTRLGGLSSVNMDLGDLARRAQEMGGKGQKTAPSAARDSRAHYLLSGSGVKPGQAYKDFQGMDADTFQTSSYARVDFAEEGAAYLRGMQSKGREAMLRESMDQIYREVDTYIEETLGIDFDEQKRKIMQHFGLVPHEEGSVPDSSSRSRFGNKSMDRTRSVFGRSAMDRSILGSTSTAPGTASVFGNSTSSGIPSALGKNQSMRDLRDKERLFVQKVEALNKSRSNEQEYSVIKHFAEVEATVGGDAPKQVRDAYHALQEITGENSAGGHVKQRQYAKEYVESSDSLGDVRWRKQVLQNSRSYLEKSFFSDLESIVDKNPRTAQIGGMPSIINKVRGYIRTRVERHDLAPDGFELQQIGENGDYCWALIFYLLRSGHVQEAADYVSNDPAFQSADKRFNLYISSYSRSPDRRLSRKLQDFIDGEYQQRAKNAPKGTVDPYRMACYKVIGRCDIGQRNLEHVGQGVEDWLWLQFTLARESESFEELSGEIFGLEQICETVTEIGQKHFSKTQADAASSYGTFFLMQILAGMFEQAVDYLHTFNAVSAVHLAIALDYYGLLRVADYQVAGNELLTFTTTQQAQINFVPLVAYYTASFRVALPVPAVDYLTLLCLNSDLQPSSVGAVHTQACHEALRELCLETREFAALLGDIREDGSRLPGAIEQRAKLIHLDTHDQFLRSITSQAASVADQRGQTADAVLLYHLCDDYDNVAAVLGRSLADAVAVELGDNPMSLQPLKPRQSSPSGGSQSTLDHPSTSLSLTQSTSSPAELATNMMGLYRSNAMYFKHITDAHSMTINILLQMLAARAQLEDSSSPSPAKALEILHGLGVLPLDTNGSIPAIRTMASAFSTLPQLVARCAGICILWCVRAIGMERERLSREGSWSAYGSEDDLTAHKNQLGQMARDLMVFAGLVKYKLPGRVYDMLTRAGGDVGSY